MKGFYARCHKGLYVPKFPEKYIGNVKHIIFRSLAERKFMRYLDMTDSVLKWASEEFFIPYHFPVDNKLHRYFPDFFAQIKTKNNEIKKYVIEVKPKSQTLAPKKKGKYYAEQVETYIKNQSKWTAAEKFCKENGAEFIILAI